MSRSEPLLASYTHEDMSSLPFLNHSFEEVAHNNTCTFHSLLRMGSMGCYVYLLNEVKRMTWWQTTPRSLSFMHTSMLFSCTLIDSCSSLNFFVSTSMKDHYNYFFSKHSHHDFLAGKFVGKFGHGFWQRLPPSPSKEF